MPTSDRSNAGPPRNGRGRFTRTIDTAARDADAARLRAEGATYEVIAAQLKYADRGDAYRGVERALRAVVREPAEHLQQIELERLDAATRAAWKVLESGDPDLVLKAVDRVVRISERRCRLLGLDAPAKYESITVDAVDAEIERLIGLLGANDREARS